MAEAETSPVRTDGLGRTLVCEGRSPDGSWHVEVFGPNEHCDFLYVYARHPEHGVWSFGVGREAVEAERIRFQWDLPNNSWGVFIDGACWAIWTRRAALRMSQARTHSRSGPHARPYTGEEVRYTCARRRGQRPGTRGFVIEE